MTFENELVGEEQVKEDEETDAFGKLFNLMYFFSDVLFRDGLLHFNAKYSELVNTLYLVLAYSVHTFTIGDYFPDLTNNLAALLPDFIFSESSQEEDVMLNLDTRMAKVLWQVAALYANDPGL